MNAGRLHPLPAETRVCAGLRDLPSMQYPRLLAVTPASWFLIEVGEVTTGIYACGRTGMTIGHAMAIVSASDAHEGVRDVAKRYLTDVDRHHVLRSTYGLPPA